MRWQGDFDKQNVDLYKNDKITNETNSVRMKLRYDFKEEEN